MTERKEYKYRQYFPLVNAPITLEDSLNSDDGWNGKCKCEKPMVVDGYRDGPYCRRCLGDVEVNNQ